jgi:cell division protein ZapA
MAKDKRMAQINVTVNGRDYTVACDDGEEAHLKDLARYLNNQVQKLADSVGQVGDTRLLLLAGLVVADELSEMLAKIDELSSELERLKTGRPPAVEKVQKAEIVAAEMLEKAARRIDDIARRISPP